MESINKMRFFKSFIILTILVKLSFIFLVFRSIYLKHLIKKYPEDLNYRESLFINDRLKHQLEFIFTILMAFILVIVFNPYKKENILLNYEVRTLLYLFGFLLIITADWGNFFNT